MERQRVLVASACVEWERLMIPQPPFLLGLARVSQLHRCCQWWSEHPDQRKLNEIFLSLSRTEVGMAASAIQKTGWPSSTPLRRV
jgi:hypothetical protein